VNDETKTVTLFNWRNVIGSMLGWGMDAYDFVAYAFVAPIIRDLYFSELGPLGSM
jgi:hypothetical protein